MKISEQDFTHKHSELEEVVWRIHSMCWTVETGVEIEQSIIPVGNSSSSNYDELS